MNFRTVTDLNKCICGNIGKIPGNIDLVVGIPRSGMLAAGLIGLYLNLPISDLNSFSEGKLYQTGTTRKQSGWIRGVDEAKTVLIVDDSISTGESMKKAKTVLRETNEKYRLLYLAVYAVPTAISAVDYYFEICNHPRIFEWNYMHAWTLEYSCVDIDGVLCDDPGLFESLNKDKYAEFIKNAPPKFIPTQKIGYLVSGRKEQYRKETEAWLDKYNIKYNHLIMLPEGKTPETMDNPEYGSYKADVYKKTDCFLFIESNYEQAVRICEVSGRQVFCFENHSLITSDNLINRAAMVRRDSLITLKRIVKKLLKTV